MNNQMFDHVIVACFYCRQLDDSDRASVFSRDTNGRTGLHHAARLGGWKVYIRMYGFYKNLYVCE